MSDAVFSLQRGRAPLLVSTPHVGTLVPGSLKPRYTARALALADTDWHVDQLYAFARDLGASQIVPRFSRYVIDLNRPPEDAPMYAGTNNTGLCPTRSFEGEPLYREGLAPDAAEVAQRREDYWRPYHDAVAAEVARIRERHGYAVLWDGHSIKSILPWLFDGRLPDLNLGTGSGASSDPALRAALQKVLAAQTAYSHVTDGRFKGGYLTRRYGRPQEQVHAVQLEMCWSCYMREEAAPYAVDPARAEQLQGVLRSLLQAALDWRPT